MIPLWQVFLDRVRPPGAIVNFSAAAFELQAAVNLRLASNFIEPTAECLARLQDVSACVKEYGELRESASTTLFSKGEKDLDDALRLLTIEMRNCNPAARASDAVAGLILADRLKDPSPHISEDSSDPARRHDRSTQAAM